MIDITYDMLAMDVGLKLDEVVAIGPGNVKSIMDKHPDIFRGWDVSPIDGSAILYGYNQLGNPVKLGFCGERIQRMIVFTKPKETTRYKGYLAYDGHRYSGFQIQNDQRTIQGELTEIISDINGENTLVQGCSRTDSGVHASNFVFHFESNRLLTTTRWKELLNYRLPHDIFVKGLEITHPLFHSRYDVLKKKYIYRIKLGDRDPLKINYEWPVKDIDIGLMEKNLKQVIGTHNFLSFCKGEPEDPVRTIFSADMHVEGDQITLFFEGDGFLRYMIRIIVFALVEISRKKIRYTMADLIDQKSRKHTKHMAPAGGLYLTEITY
ncbi:MAG TPA: tRNA pseudouridine(38-40) synthase TruA [Bacillota bacterium]|nr:tRNA pseudouridine(38-40) synthase TruA [Bacillota bacterium]